MQRVAKCCVVTRRAWAVAKISEIVVAGVGAQLSDSMTRARGFAAHEDIADNVIAMPICLECGASGTGSCQCGAGYVPAGERAKAAIAANPGKSDRATAAEIGVHKNTVARARDTSGPHGPVDQPRTGLDGQTRRPLS